MQKRRLPGWVGSVGIALWVWYWDTNHESISSWWWSLPQWLRAGVWGLMFSHIVFGRPRRVLIIV